MFTRLQEVLGEEHATILMEHLPPLGWADVATKHDIEALRVATGKDIEALGKDIEALRVATKHDLAELETRLDLRFEAALERGLNRQTRTFVTWLIAGMAASSATVGGIAIGAARLS